MLEFTAANNKVKPFISRITGEREKNYPFSLRIAVKSQGTELSVLHLQRRQSLQATNSYAI